LKNLASQLPAVVNPRKTAFIACCVAVGVSGCMRQALAETDAFADIVRPVLLQNCVKCHGKSVEVSGDVNLLDLQTADDLTSNLKLLREVIEVLDSSSMPPEDELPLAPETRRQIVTQLNSILQSAIDALRTFPRAPIRRMNRFQYNNAVQDLFRLSVDVFALPERMLRDHNNYFQPATGNMPEKIKAGSRPLGKSQLIDKRLAGVTPFPQDLRAEHGFDNRGDHLSLSPLLLESFLKLSRSIVESDDFNEQTCQVWSELFASPHGSDQISDTALVVRRRLQVFLTRAFRRPVDEEILCRYVGHVLARIEAGDSFAEAMKDAVSAALASPRFLYLYDRASSGKQIERVDDFELASRLALFLWGSIPDPQLLDLAAAQQLRDPDVLDRELDRMLNDARLKRFCDSFPAQWLQLERIISAVPDPKRFPEFYFAKYRVSMHMMLEPLLLFETILVENRSVLELIDSDFSYRSEPLKSWYHAGRQSGATPAVLSFARVAVTDRRQGGVVTNSAVMTMTSAPLETKPITRGAWVASVLFNDPPEPPPANVPPLPDDDPGSANNLTLRQRLDVHRKRHECAGCHAQIDPLGFALENYGPTGVWREVYENGQPVDASGVLFGKHDFTNIVEFKDAILAEKRRFTRGFAAHLLAFALGRAVEPADWPALEQIVIETAAADYRFRPLIKQIVLSEPFLHKFNPREGPDDANRTHE